MRTLALALLAVTAGCNWFFGMSQTYRTDAPQLDVFDAIPNHGVLLWWESTSSPFDVISYTPIADATVQFGALDGELYDGHNGSGGFEINEPPGQPYRLVYTLAGDPTPHEIQWPITSNVRLAVPVFGRLTRTTPPTGSGDTWTLSNASSPYPCLPSPPNPPCTSQRTGLTVFTTGAWMTGTASYAPTSNSIGFQTSSLQGLSGAVDNLDAPSRDTFVLVHYTTASQPPDMPWHVDGYAIPAKVDPWNGTIAAEGSVLLDTQADGTAVMLRYQPQPLPPDDAIKTALGGLYYAVSAASGQQAIGGVLPNFVMPAMTLPIDGGFDGSVFFAMDNQITPSATSCGTFAFPWNYVDMSPDEFRPPAVLYRMYRARPASPGGPTIYSGFQKLTTAFRLGTCTSSGGPMVPTLTLDIAIAMNATFAATPLTADNTPIVLPANSFAKVTFDLDAASLDNTNDCIVTAYRIDGANLVALRSVLVPPAAHNEAHFPTQDFTASASHVFGIVCRNGYPNASFGDYTVFGGYPQQESQLFPGTFTVTFQ